MSCWVHARCGFVKQTGRPDRVIVTMQKSQMGDGGDVWDVFSGLFMMYSMDGGEHWHGPIEQSGLAPWNEGEDITVVVSDFTPQWHSRTRRLLGIGHTCRYQGGKLQAQPRMRDTAYSVYDADSNSWGKRQFLEMPDRMRFFSAGAGSVQWVELPDGDILLPIYFRGYAPKERNLRTAVVVLRCGFDGEMLQLKKIGRELYLPVYRGLGEPSLIDHNGVFYMTIRSGERAYVSKSCDGLNFKEPVPWTFEDGVELRSCDTQQHWAKAGGKLYLVYTRSGLDNDHVVRNRAPLLIAEVDTETLCVLRTTEQVAVPDQGALLGNFGVAQYSDEEAWICVSEWMENAGSWNEVVWEALRRKYPYADLDSLEKTPGRCGLCELGGSDNRVYLVRVKARRENADDAAACADLPAVWGGPVPLPGATV